MKKWMVCFLAVIFCFSLMTPFSLAYDAMANGNEIITIIVEVEGEPLLAGADAATLGAQAYTATTAAKETLNSIHTAQKKAYNQIVQKVDSRAKVQYTYTNVLNGFAMDVKKSDISKISALPGVLQVYQSQERHLPTQVEPRLSQGTPTMIGSDFIWNDNGYKGEGSTVAVIDTELDVNHEFFRLTNESTAKLDKKGVEEMLDNNVMNIKGLTVNQVYRNAKIPFAYNYAYDNGNVYFSQEPMIHGTHVSGIVAGNGEKFTGVAPEA